MLRRIRWKAVVVGAVVAYLLAMLFGLVNATKFAIDLEYTLAGVKTAGGVTRGTTQQWALLNWLSLVTAGFTSFMALFVGGCVAGRMTGISGGLNGTMASVLSMLLLYLAPMAAFIARNGAGAVSSIFSSENVSMGMVSGPFFLVVAISAGYLGESWVGAFTRLPSEVGVEVLRQDRGVLDQLRAIKSPRLR